MKVKIFNILLLFIFTSTYSQVKQTINDTSNDKKNVDFNLKVENLIIEHKLDSAIFFITKQKIKQPSDYLSILERISSKSATYNDYYKLAEKINNRHSNELNSLTNYVKNIPIPTNKQNVELDYVYCNWLLITKLRNSSKFEQATEINKQLTNYVQKFDQANQNVKKANLLLSNHQIVLFLIEGNTKDGKELTLQGLKTATKLNDNTLRIIFLNHLCDFLIYERDLDGFINNS